MSFNLTNQEPKDTFQHLVQYDAGIFYDGLGNVIVLNFGTVNNIATAGLISGGPITTSGTITTSINTNKLVGRSTSGVGEMEEITLGTNLYFSGTTLNVTIPNGVIAAIDDTPTIKLSNTSGTLTADFVSMNISQFDNDISYLITETDPAFLAWLNSSPGPNISVFTNDAGYLTSASSETDPVFSTWLSSSPIPISVNEEVPAGLIDDSNPTFTTQYIPYGDTIQVYINGLRMKRGADFTLNVDGGNNTNIITMTQIPWPGCNFFVSYDYKP